MSISEFALKQGEYLDFVQKELEIGLGCGLYRGEDSNFFQPFFEDYRMKMNNLGGERNEKLKEIRTEMQRRSNEFNPLLSLIECDVNDQIKKILWNLETRNPFESEMRTLDNYEKKKSKLLRDIKDLSDPSSRIYRMIFEGKRKRNLKIMNKRQKNKSEKDEEVEGEEEEEEVEEDDDENEKKKDAKKKKKKKKEEVEEDIMTDEQIREYITNIVEIKKENLEKSIRERKLLLDQLNQIPKFVSFTELLNKLVPFEQEWKDAEMKVGSESNQNGEDLESEKMIGTAIRYIVENKMKVKFEDVVIFRNCDWVTLKEKKSGRNNKNKLKLLGEVDVVICDKSSGKVISLVECKARCFDIAAGSRQSSITHRRKKGKLGLRLSKKNNGNGNGNDDDTEIIIQEVGDVPVFVITCIQENDYILKFESCLKEDLYDLTYKRLVRSESTYTVEEIFNILIPKYEALISPLDWFKLYSKDFLVVVK